MTFAVLPLGTQRLQIGEARTVEPHPVVDVRASVSWQPRSFGAVAAEVRYENEPNRQRFSGGMGGFIPSIVDSAPVRIYISLIAQLRF